MLDVLKAKDVVEQVLKFAGWTEDFYDSFCNPVRRQSVNTMFEAAERPKIFDIFIKRSILKNEGGKLTEEDDALIAQVKGVMAIDDIAAEGQATKNFGPKLFSVMDRAMREIIEDYTPALAETLKAEIHQVIDDFKINRRMIAQNGRSLYQQALNVIQAKAPAGVPTKEQNEALHALQELFMLESKETTPHASDYLWIGLSQEFGRSHARELFLSAVKKRMIPMVEWIVSEMERTVFTQQQLAQRRQKDLGEDYFQSGKTAEGTLGLGAEINILGDIMNLVDFYMENGIAEQQQIGTKKIEKTIEEDGEKKVVEEEVPIYETLYPITALETGAVDQKMAEVLFRQFVVGSFTTQGPNAVRYEKSRATFGGILGLSSKEMETISSTIGETVYDNYVGQSLRTKGALDQQDMMFLANLQTKLGLTVEQGEAMLKNAQQKILMDELEDIMSSPAPSVVKAFREKINSMGLSLSEDVGVSTGRLIRMFEVEVSPGLESGEITPDSGEVLAEIQESLGLSEEDAARALENMILVKSNRDFEKISKDVRRGRVSEIVVPLKRLVRFGGFLNGQLGIEIEEKIGRQIFNTYENFDFEGLSSEEIEDNKEMLKTILSLS
ncbi:Chloroplast envelope transporter [Fragilaria crotonensis]|nr:Chloroplast envelope transporter [Fragilaria crotonensis]